MDCSAEGCHTEPKGRGLCALHYMRLRRTGQTAYRKPEADFRTLLAALATEHGPDACWPWPRLNPQGYGSAAVNGLKLAHRISWSMANGRSPGGAMICHRCNNRACVNPAHLYAGDAQSNADNMMAAGRWNNGRMRLSAEQVAAIRDMAEVGMPRVQIAKLYGITAQYVGQLAKGLRRVNR